MDTNHKQISFLVMVKNINGKIHQQILISMFPWGRTLRIFNRLKQIKRVTRLQNEGCNILLALLFSKDIEQANKAMEGLTGMTLPSSDRGGMHIE